VGNSYSLGEAFGGGGEIQLKTIERLPYSYYVVLKNHQKKGGITTGICEGACGLGDESTKK